jgi:hypothetical protein
VIAVHPEDGKKVYAAFAQKTSVDGQGNTNVDIYFVKTDDATATNANGDDLVVWGEPTIVPAGIEVAGDQFFPWIEVTKTGDTTRVHLMFFDTRHNPNQPDGNSDPSCLLDVYYAYSDDEGQTWHEYRLTPASFDVEDSGPPLESGSPFFGDYNGMAVAGNRVYPIFPMIAGTPAAAEAHMCCIVFGDAATLEDFTVEYGSVNSGDLDSLADSDDDRLNIAAGALPSPTAPHRCEVVVGLTNTETSPDTIDITLESSNSLTSVSGRISLWNWVPETSTSMDHS